MGNQAKDGHLVECNGCEGSAAAGRASCDKASARIRTHSRFHPITSTDEKRETSMASGLIEFDFFFASRVVSSTSFSALMDVSNMSTTLNRFHLLNAGMLASDSDAWWRRTRSGAGLGRRSVTVRCSAVQSANGGYPRERVGGGVVRVLPGVLQPDKKAHLAPGSCRHRRGPITVHMQQAILQ